MSNQFQFDVFLSHNSKDKPRVRRLAERLKQAGLRVWFDEWCVGAGDIIALKVDEGLERSRVLLLCISPNALASGWVALERSTAVHRDPANTERRFIPLLLADCELPDTLRRYKYVDFRDEAEAAFAELLAVCRPEAGEAPATSKPEPKKKPSKKKPQPKRATEQTEPLARLERKLTGRDGSVDSIAVSPDGNFVAAGIGDHVEAWNLRTGLDHKASAKVADHNIHSLTFTANGKWIITTDSGIGEVRVLDSTSLEERQVLGGHSDQVWSVVSPRDENRVISAAWDNSVRVWDLLTGDCLKVLQLDCSDLFRLHARDDASRAISGHRDGTVRHWNLETGECLATLKGHSELVVSVQIAPDGRFAVSGSDDKTIKVWDLKTETCVGSLEGHQDDVQSLAFSHDGALIASASFDDTVRLWDWKLGACLQVIEVEEPNFPLAVAFSPDGLRLVVGTHKSSVYVYRLTGVRTAPAAEATRRYVNAKVVLIGEGTVGKTSLAHRLIEDKYVVRDRTHGMNVWRLDLPQSPRSQLEVVEEREVLLWDLAGQEDYRIIHQLFLDETALAVLLINPQKDDPFAEAGDWLKALKTAAGTHESNREAARLLVFSQVDVGRMKLGNAKIERFCEQYGFAGWLPTSAKTGENCSDKKNGGQPSKLKQLIAESTPWDKLPWTSTPRLLVELKNAVVAMRDQKDIRLLRFAELAQRLEQALPGERFGESDVRTAVTLLANHGLARPLKFGDLVLLQPELINGYAGAIVRAARAHTDEIGCVLEADIYHRDFDFTGVERLKHRPDEELLLRALVQTFLDHSLCIAEDTPQGRHLVFPSQYRREKDIPREPDTFVSYTFSGEWQTVWTTLVVRLWYSSEFEHRELWRNAAEFASTKGHTLGLKIDHQQGEGRGTISLYFDKEVSDELKAILIEYVHRHLARYACEVMRDRRYVCPECGKPVMDYDEVRKRLAAKKDFIYCQGCDKKVPLIDFIERRLKSDPVARRILAMEETATRELDTQALEQILIGHMMAIAGEANQIFRPVAMFDYGIDGEVEFRDDDGKASGKRIYVQLKSGNSYLRTRKSDGSEVFDLKDNRHLDYWVSQPVDVYLVIRQTDETMGGEAIRWMNVTRYLKARKDKKSRQIIFKGEKLDMEAVWKVRDGFFP